jgi:hypothetical protein
MSSLSFDPAFCEIIAASCMVCLRTHHQYPKPAACRHMGIYANHKQLYSDTKKKSPEAEVCIVTHLGQILIHVHFYCVDYRKCRLWRCAKSPTPLANMFVDTSRERQVLRTSSGACKNGKFCSFCLARVRSTASLTDTTQRTCPAERSGRRSCNSYSGNFISYHDRDVGGWSTDRI